MVDQNSRENNIAKNAVKSEDTTRTDRSKTSVFKDFMASGWEASEPYDLKVFIDLDLLENRRKKLVENFKNKTLVLPAGQLKQRSNDTDYRFRPHSAFAYYTGLGIDHEPQAVLVVTNDASTLYLPPLADSSQEDFYASPRYGQFWIGSRPSAQDFEKTLGLSTAPLENLEQDLQQVIEKYPSSLFLLREADPELTHTIDMFRHNITDQKVSQFTKDSLPKWSTHDKVMEEFTSEVRLIKDAQEIAHLQTSVDKTIEGFKHVIQGLPTALKSPRGERVIETKFFSHARQTGNDLGYDTIAATGNNATTLHWIANSGEANAGELLLLDAGVEDESLYTADLTRTIPLNGIYSPVQKKIYDAVLEAAHAGFMAAVPGNKFRHVHDAAMDVLAHKLEEWDILPLDATTSLEPEQQFHRRWMPHGTSHHLGLDVHDCSHARSELYMDGVIEPGMVFTIEPGLYFKNEDTLIPDEFKGIGVRIEDDIYISEDGPVNLSASLPRTTEDVEQWIQDLQQQTESK